MPPRSRYHQRSTRQHLFRLPFRTKHLLLINLSVLLAAHIIVLTAGVDAMTVPSLTTTDGTRTTHTFEEWKPRRIPPGPLIIGYAHNSTSGKVNEAIMTGINVVCWSFVDMVVSSESESPNEEAVIQTNLNIEAIRAIRDLEGQENVLHIAAIGGWNGPHPPLGLSSGAEWCRLFVEFNKRHGYIFDGIDWDLEGEDDRNGPRSKFSMETLDVMAEFSLEAKQNYGMLVSMAPAESYLDAIANEGVDTEFSLDLNLPPRAWMNHSDDRTVVEKAGFAHAGRQCYTYVLSKAGIESFDWVALQLYEAYSPYTYETTRQQQQEGTASHAIVQRAEALMRGYKVTNMPPTQRGGGTSNTKHIQVPLSKLVIGVANGWADGRKFCKVDPESLRESWMILKQRHGEGYRGAMFWTIDEEGSGGVHMASSLTSVFRPKSSHRNNAKDREGGDTEEEL